MSPRDLFVIAQLRPAAAPAAPLVLRPPLLRLVRSLVAGEVKNRSFNHSIPCIQVRLNDACLFALVALVSVRPPAVPERVGQRSLLVQPELRQQQHRRRVPTC